MITRPQTARLHCQLMFFAVLSLILSGCQSSLSYRAAELPPELAAPPAFNGQQFDVSRLGSTGAGAELIYPGDKLTVVVASGNDEDEPRTSELPVTEDGTVDVPFIGQVNVAGLTESQAAEAVRRASMQRQIFVRPSVSVAFSKKRMHKVMVGGAVAEPGEYEIRPGSSTLAAAIVAAGGLSKKATPRITVHRPGSATSGRGLAASPDTAVLQAGHDAEHGANSSSDFAHAESSVVQVSLLSPESSQAVTQQNLPDGTVITVQEQPARYVSVIGLTGNSNIELPHDREYRVLDALAQAGGPRYSPWIANKLKIVRPHPETGEAVAIRLKLGEAQRNRDANIALAPGDILSVEETPLTFAISTVGALLGLGRSAVTAATVP